MNYYMKINHVFCWRHVWPCNQTTKHVDYQVQSYDSHLFGGFDFRGLSGVGEVSASHRWGDTSVPPPIRSAMHEAGEILWGKNDARNALFFWMAGFYHRIQQNLRGIWNPPQICYYFFLMVFVCVHNGLVFLFKSLEVFEMIWKGSKVCKGASDDRISKRHTSYDSCRIPVGICM